MKPVEASVRERMRRLRALAVDVDGVLTDGGMYYGPDGEALKKFNARDGMGLALLRERGLHVAIVTGEDTQIVLRRAEKLKIDASDVYLGASDKEAALRDFLGRHGLAPEEVAYIGDDVNDLPAMRIVSVAFAVADAADEVRRKAHVVLERRGGEGAVREAAELILAIRGGPRDPDSA
jgi:YrbI family 3-deoxy-D-manno-octulosonate 8-phosphate phosphatase